MRRNPPTSFFFFFNDTATTEIYTLSLHDALPIWSMPSPRPPSGSSSRSPEGSISSTSGTTSCRRPTSDRKSTGLNSSHDQISYAVFCLKKKKKACRQPSMVTELLSHREQRELRRS